MNLTFHNCGFEKRRSRFYICFVLYQHGTQFNPFRDESVYLKNLDGIISCSLIDYKMAIISLQLIEFQVFFPIFHCTSMWDTV